MRGRGPGRRARWPSRRRSACPRLRPGVKHDVALEPPLQLDGDRDALTLLDRDVPRRDRERRVRPAAQQGALQRDSPLRIQRPPRSRERARAPPPAHASGPDTPPGHDPIERQRLRLDLGLFLQGIHQARGHAFGVDQLLGKPGILDDGSDPLAKLRETGSRSRRRFAAWSTTARATITRAQRTASVTDRQGDETGRPRVPG